MGGTSAQFRDASAAHIAKGALAAEGIEAVVCDEYLVGVNWLYSDAIGGVKLAVNSSVAPQAMVFLHEFDDTPNAEANPALSFRFGRAVGIVLLLALSAVVVPALIVGLPFLARDCWNWKRPV